MDTHVNAAASLHLPTEGRRPPSRLSRWFRLRRGVSREECYLLTRQLAVLHRAGVPLLQGLHALAEQRPGGALRQVLRAVHHDIVEGRTLSQALARHPGVFDPIYVGLIRVGEAGGLLDEVLTELARLLEWESDVRQRLQQAFFYPCIVLATLSAALLVMVVFVLPQFARLFQSFRIELPIQTRLLIGLSHGLSHYGWMLLLLGVGAALAVGVWVRTEAGRLRWHRRLLRLPLLGPTLLHFSLARCARVAASLAQCGVPILETLALVRDSVANRVLRLQWQRVQERVRAGEALSGALKAQRMFPAVVVQMVATGEQTGHLPELLRGVAEFYDQQVTYTVRRLMTTIEPTLLLVVGLGVLLMATAVFVPMWDLVQALKQAGR